MKIRFDENIANRIACAVMEVVANREGYEVSFVRHGDGAPDPNWLTTFAAEDGTAIVSGDHDILQHWPNLIAYTESGLISFFPPKPCWEQRKVSFMRLSASLDSPTAQPQPVGPAIPLLRDGSAKVRREPKNARLGGVLRGCSERVSQAKLP